MVASTRIHLIIFALYSIATLLVGGKAIEDKKVSPATSITGATPELPPLIFPTDKNNIMPINKTALKILLHEDDLANSSSSSGSMTKKDKDMTQEDGEADDLQKTDQQFVESEEERAKEFKLHHLVVAPPPAVDKTTGFKDQVEYFQEGSKKGADELEEQYNRPQQNFMSVSITQVDMGKDVLRDHLALVSVAIVIALTLSIFGVLMFWRHKLEQRYGNRHRLFNDEDSIHDITL